MNDKLKKLIFKKLYDDLADAEVIECIGSIWFIDREEKYWYLEYEKSGKLWWRYQFFLNFFNLFSIEQNEYELIIKNWVEEVLNCKIDITKPDLGEQPHAVDKVLNCNK